MLLLSNRAIFRAVVGFSALGIVVCSTPTLATWQAADDDGPWSILNIAPAQDALIPVKSERLFVAYRAIQDSIPSVNEKYFAIEFGPRHRATVVNPIGESISNQLMSLHRTNRRAPFESWVNRIKIERLTTDVKACPAISTQLKSLQTISVRMREDPDVSNPAMPGVGAIVWHEIVVNQPQPIDVSLNNTNSRIAQWALQTLDILSECVR